MRGYRRRAFLQKLSFLSKTPGPEGRKCVKTHKQLHAFNQNLIFIIGTDCIYCKINQNQPTKTLVTLLDLITLFLIGPKSMDLS